MIFWFRSLYLQYQVKEKNAGSCLYKSTASNLYAPFLYKSAEDKSLSLM